MKRAFKYFGFVCLTGFIVASLYAINLFLMRPYSIDHYLAKELVMGLIDSPEAMTSLGIFDDYNILLKHNQKLSIGSLKEDEENHADNVKQLEILQGYNSDRLSDVQKVTKEIAIFDVENDINGFNNFRYHSYPFNQISGNHLNIVEFMTDMHPVRNYREASDYIKRVKLFDDVFEANLIWLNEQKKVGIFAPRYVFDHVIKQLKELIAYQDNENPLFKVFKKKLEDLDVSESKKDQLMGDLSVVIRENVKPAFVGVLDFMESNYENANKHHGVWSLPNGEDYYAARLRSYTTTNYSAEEIHQIGLAEVERIGKRMKEIFTELGYEVDKPVGAMMNDLNENPDFLYADTPDRKEIVVADYNKMVKEAEEGVKPYFNKFPLSPVEVRAVPEYSEKTAAGGYYQSPSLDGS